MNITISLAVLMVALNAQKPLDFSAFPTVLLFATLFRLGLNVASTRVVLVHGHEGEAAAGQVIEAFGSFLIGGDYVVGIFVFAILIIINLELALITPPVGPKVTWTLPWPVGTPATLHAPIVEAAEASAEPWA